MKITIGFSPCPNDTYIFDALVNRKIDTAGFYFEPILEDVETLNKWALQGNLDVTKLSYPAYFNSMDHYQLLDAGSAMGIGVGPLLISARKKVEPGEINNSRIAIPGLNTTANFLLSFAFPEAVHRLPMVFSRIEDAVLDGKAELGVIIHENRFTYASRGLHMIADLGKTWEEKTGLPVPLGCIAAHKRISKENAEKISGLIRQSLEYAHQNYPELPPFVRQHSQAMDEAVMRKHIQLYVNDYSLSLGAEGHVAINKLYEIFLSARTDA